MKFRHDLAEKKLFPGGVGVFSKFKDRLKPINLSRIENCVQLISLVELFLVRMVQVG